MKKTLLIALISLMAHPTLAGLVSKRKSSTGLEWGVDTSFTAQPKRGMVDSHYPRNKLSETSKGSMMGAELSADGKTGAVTTFTKGGDNVVDEASFRIPESIVEPYEVKMYVTDHHRWMHDNKYTAPNRTAVVVQRSFTTENNGVQITERYMAGPELKQAGVRTQLEFSMQSRYVKADLSAIDMGSTQRLDIRLNSYNRKDRSTSDDAYQLDFGPEDGKLIGFQMNPDGDVLKVHLKKGSEIIVRSYSIQFVSLQDTRRRTTMGMDTSYQIELGSRQFVKSSERKLTPKESMEFDVKFEKTALSTTVSAPVRKLDVGSNVGATK